MDNGLLRLIYALVVVRGEVRTSDSPADQRRSISLNVSGAARTWMEIVAARRPRTVGRKCIVGLLVVDAVLEEGIDRSRKRCTEGGGKRSIRRRANVC